MKMKRFMVAALATAMTVGSVMTASAAWVQEGANWKFQNDNGTYQANKWLQDSGKWYHFDGAGNMQKGWFQDTDGKWYFFKYDGSMVTGLIKVNDNVYFMDEHGALFIGDKVIGGTTYHFDVNGTTNGKPSVPLTSIYGSNGNQALSGGGGSSSSGSSGGGGGSHLDRLQTVGTEADLKEKLAAGYTNIEYKTDAAGTVVLTADEEYKDVSLTVNAPNQSIENNIVFKSVAIDAIKANTWTENAEGGNKITLNSDARIINMSAGTSVNVAKVNLQIKLEGDNAIALNIGKKGATIIADVAITATVSEQTTLVVNDTNGSKVTVTEPVSVDVKSTNPTAGAAQLEIVTTARAEIKTAIPAAITASEEITLTITNSAAATGVSIKAADEKADESVAKTQIKNESTAEVTVEVKNSDDTVAKTEEKEAGVTAEDSVKAGIADAVKSANGSAYIGAASTGDEIVVTIKQDGTQLINALPTARSIFNIFMSVDGVKGIEVVGDEGSAGINDEAEMINAARTLGFNGATELSKVKGDYEVTVYYEGGQVEYLVKIK